MYKKNAVNFNRIIIIHLIFKTLFYINFFIIKSNQNFKKHTKIRIVFTVNSLINLFE